MANRFLTAAVVAAGLVGCAGGGDFDAPPAPAVELASATDVAPLPLPAPAVEPAPAPAPVAAVAVQELVLAPVAGLEAAVARAAEELTRETGLTVRVGAPGEANGVPVTVAPTVTHRGRPVNAVARFSKWCSWGTCTGDNTSITLELAICPGGEKERLLHNTLMHEVIHVLSGWGECVDSGLGLQMADSMHLQTGVDLVSNGNNGYAQMTLTAADVLLARSCVD